MKIRLIDYVIVKIILIIAALYFFMNPEIFATKGYQLAIHGVVVCRGLSLIAAFYIASTLVDNIYKNNEN